MESDERESIDPPQEPHNGSVEGDSVGYGEPPKGSRFQHGQSGNPKGRPQGRKDRKKIVEEVANEMHWVDEGGKRRQRSTLEIVLLFIRNQSLEGKARAFQTYFDLLVKYGPQQSESGAGYLIVPEPLTTEEWAEKNGIEIIEAEEI
jgi:hypothetical protein